MKSLYAIIPLLLFASAMETSAQFTRANDRTWHAVRGGILVGATRTTYSGDVPFKPTPENLFFGNGSGTNFTFGVNVEKALSRLILFGARFAFDPMSVKIEGDFTEPYRISDSQGRLYDVTRKQVTEYVIRYFSLGIYFRLYPTGGPGPFIGGGGTLSALLQDSYLNAPVIVEPDWARGSESRSEKGGIPDIHAIRYSLDAMIGYEFFFSYGFASPELHYNIGLNEVADASYAETWDISNLRFLLNITFPLPY